MIKIFNFGLEEKHQMIQQIFGWMGTTKTKTLRWGSDDKFPQNLINLRSSVPIHDAAINFAVTNIVKNIESNYDLDLDYWDFLKLVDDYLTLGGFCLQNTKLRNGSNRIEYVPISECRLSTKKDEVSRGVLNTETNKIDFSVYNRIYNINDGDGIMFYSNYTSRNVYPTPFYVSALIDVSTAKSISEFHNNNALNGFTPSSIINFIGNEPTQEIKEEIYEQFKTKFSGVKGEKFILNWSKDKDSAIKIDKIENDKLDEKFESLQNFLVQNIALAHRLTSMCLIGYKNEYTGFTQTEYEESLNVYTTTVINGYRKEISYALSSFLNKNVNI